MREFKSATGKTFLTINFDSKNNLIYNNWIGYASSENIMQGATSFLEVLQETNCASTITDNSEFVGPWENSIEWLCENWIPSARAAGLKFYAHIANKGSFADEAARKLANCVESAFEMKVFESLMDAQEWIKSKTQVTVTV
ncbi:hypothetical protein [Pontibacter cellulosilyticus]|uniref:STAS/SEC14 domain-containing protein n=1 Tax=Pontibacter cellulosilyticus TaxID=1720253 RepID=A0A923N6E9_9BACT|nr:hypothetical protein [Pontibacter cellulosilyticus]MBC5993508.1 hypothetical protein [Pontibacter cellulosilyticus]